MPLCEERRLRERLRFEAGELLRRGGELLGVGFEDLAGRGKAPEVVRAGESLAVLGVERYGLRVMDIAAALAKHPATATGWVMRGVRRRHENPEEAARVEELAPAPAPAFDDYWAGVPALLRWRAVLWMLYAGVSEADLGDGRADSPAIGLAWSVDGRHWQRGPANPVLGDAGALWAPAVVLDPVGHRLLIWFENPSGIGLAVAPEPVVLRPPTRHRVAP